MLCVSAQSQHCPEAWEQSGQALLGGGGGSEQTEAWLGDHLG